MKITITSIRVMCFILASLGNTVFGYTRTPYLYSAQATEPTPHLNRCHTHTNRETEKPKCKVYIFGEMEWQHSALFKQKACIHTIQHTAVQPGRWRLKEVALIFVQKLKKKQKHSYRNEYV